MKRAPAFRADDLEKVANGVDLAVNGWKKTNCFLPSTPAATEAVAIEGTA